LLCCLVLCLWLLCISRHKRAIEAARRELVRKRDRVRTAVLSMKRLNYPLCVMSLADFRKVRRANTSAASANIRKPLRQ